MAKVHSLKHPHRYLKAVDEPECHAMPWPFLPASLFVDLRRNTHSRS